MIPVAALFLRSILRYTHTASLRFAAFLSLFLAACSGIVGYPVHPQAAPAVDRLLSDDKILIQESKVELNSLGASAMPALRDAIQKATPKQQVRLIAMAMQIGEPQELLEEILFSAADSSSPYVRNLAGTKATSILSKSSSITAKIKGTTAENTLHKLLHDSEPKVRITAFTALAKSDHKDSITNEDLDRLIHDEDPAVMTAAAVMAAERGYRFTEFTQADVQPSLIKHLTDPQPLVRANACKALGLLGAVGDQSVSALRKVLSQESNTVVTLQAAVALSRIGEPNGLKAAIPVLRKLAGHSESAVRIAATTALAQAEIRNSRFGGE